jgi:hypothetical protein
LFDADGSIYVKNARHAKFLESSNASEYWLNRRITARSLRIEISLVGEHNIISNISQCMGLSLLKSGKATINHNSFTSFRLMAN